MRAPLAPLLLCLLLLAPTRRCEADAPTGPHAVILDMLLRGDMPGVVAASRAALAAGVPDVAPAAAAAAAAGASLVPTLHHMLGIALHDMGDIEGAIVAFAGSLVSDPASAAGWANLGDCLLHTWRVEEAIWAFESALLEHRVTDDASKLYKARAWVCNWRDREVLTAMTRAGVAAALAEGREPPASGADFIDVGPAMLLKMTEKLAARLSKHAGGGDVEALARVDAVPPPRRPLRVGERAAACGSRPRCCWGRGSLTKAAGAWARACGRFHII